MRRNRLLAGALGLLMIGTMVSTNAATANAAGQCSRDQYGVECKMDNLGGTGDYLHGGIGSALSRPPYRGNAWAQVLTGNVWLDRSTDPAFRHWQGPIGYHPGVTPFVPAGNFYWRACTQFGNGYRCTLPFKL